MSDETRLVLRDFLDALETIGEEHEEVYDTDVRERMAAAITAPLVGGADSSSSTADYGMFSDEGNSAVKRAVDQYLSAIVPLANRLGLDEQARRSAVWDADAASSQGTPVDEFLGWID